MPMENVVLILVLVLILGAAALYVYKAKKRGDKCVGCPYSKQCGKTGCSCNQNKK